MWFEKIQYYFMIGVWNKAMVRNAVAKHKITLEEYEIITGEVYA